MINLLRCLNPLVITVPNMQAMRNEAATLARSPGFIGLHKILPSDSE